jgi:hypothetical protein
VDTSCPTTLFDRTISDGLGLSESALVTLGDGKGVVVLLRVSDGVALGESEPVPLSDDAIVLETLDV